MKDRLIAKTTLTLAKKAGFNPKIYFLGGVTRKEERPTQSLLQKWLREKHNIHVEVQNTVFCIDAFDSVIKYMSYINDDAFCVRITYEGCLEAGLKKGLKLIKL